MTTARDLLKKARKKTLEKILLRRVLGNINFLLKKRIFVSVHGPGPDGACASCWYEPLRVKKLSLLVCKDKLPLPWPRLSFHD